MTIRYFLKNLIAELVKRSGKPELEFASVAELNDYFNNKKIDLNEINQRRNGYVSCLVNGLAKINTGQKAEELKALVVEDISNAKEVKGRIANKGFVKGKARIISFVARDYNEQVMAFKQGEILVTGMTRPQIVHLCKLALAIVTDEGGITSHAAVVSREFNVPCVIATHNATKIFKTGDTIEVDANTGIIKLVERSSV